MKTSILLMAVVVFAIACGQPGHFIPGKSPTVTPYYNPQGTPSAPIVITPDLPEGWRWQYSRGFPAEGKDNWLLLGAVDSSGFGDIMGAIVHDGGDCWALVGTDVPDPTCISHDKIGKHAVEILVASYENRPDPTATIGPDTPLGAFKIAFEPDDASEDQQVHQLADGSFIWTASVSGGGIYRITECPPGETAPPDGRCVRGEFTNTTKYAMEGVQIVCDGRRDTKTPPIQLSIPVQPGQSTSWLWVRSPIVDPYSCEITWTTGR